MTWIYPAFALGYLLCFLIMRRQLKRVEFDKQILLDFNEKLVRDREVVEEQLKAQDQIVEAHCEHLKYYDCVFREGYLPDETQLEAEVFWR